MKNNKWFFTISSIVFTVVAIAHLGIILFQMPASVGDYTVPYEINGLVVILLGYLAVRGFMAASKL
mgnify:CR=1 FL=1